MVLSLQVGGLERIVVNLARHSRAEGIDVVVYCLDSLGPLAAGLENDGIRCRFLGRREGFDLLLPFRLARWFRADRVRIVHAHNYGALTYGALASAPAGRLPVVYTVHGLDSARRRIAARLHALGLVSETVFVSHDSARAAADAGVARGRTRVLHNGIDMGSQRPARPRAEVRRELGIADAEIVVGTLSRLSPVKRHSDLLDAHRILRDRGHAVRCLVVGGGELLEPLRERAAALSVASSVTFAGWRSDVPDVLSAMDVFVLPSDSEGLSVTLLEAMAQGLPVVASNVGGNPEVVVDGETGWLVPARDPAALATTVETLVTDPLRRATMGEAGRRRLTDHFSHAAMVAGYRALYDQLLAP